MRLTVFSAPSCSTAFEMRSVIWPSRCARRVWSATQVRQIRKGAPRRATRRAPVPSVLAAGSVGICRRVVKAACSVARKRAS
jgi:hypothetical protein